MARYEVTLPVHGYIVVEVEADNEKAAIKTAACFDWNVEDVQELNAYTRIVEGNVVYVTPYHAEVEELEG